MVGAAGLELAASCSQSRRSSQLSYAPDCIQYTEFITKQKAVILHSKEMGMTTQTETHMEQAE